MIGKLGSQPTIQQAAIDQTNSELENAKLPSQTIPETTISNAQKYVAAQTGDYMMAGQFSRMVLDKLLVDTAPKQTGETMKAHVDPEYPVNPNTPDPGHIDPEYPVVPHDSPAPSQPAGPNDLLMKGSYGPEVTQLQKELNFWCATQAKDGIAADGKFGPATEALLKEYQEANGLKVDGKAGPTTKAALEITCRPMDELARSVAMDQLRKYEDNPAARENLMKLVRDPDFHLTSGNTQFFALDNLQKNPADPVHAANVTSALQEMKKLESDPAFLKLSPENQAMASTTMFHSADQQAGVFNFSGLVTDPAFGKLDSTAQKRIINTIYDRNDAGLCPTYRSILNSNSYNGMDDRMQSYVLTLAENNSKDGYREIELAALMNDPQFASATREQQMAQLKPFEREMQPEEYR